MTARTSILPPDDLFDRDQLNRQTSGDEKLAREVLALFCGRIEAELAGLGADRAGALHTLKGAAAALGATALLRSVVAAEAAPQDEAALGNMVRVARQTLALARDMAR